MPRRYCFKTDPGSDAENNFGKGIDVIQADRWKQVPFPHQMGNIASEISRAARFQDQKDGNYLEGSLLRALELIDLTLEAQAGNSRTKELCRFREVVCDWLCGTQVYSIQPQSLASYALNFSLLNG